MAFAMSWDDVIISIFVTGPKVTTLPIKIHTQMKTGVTPEINALCKCYAGCDHSCFTGCRFDSEKAGEKTVE